MEWEIRPQPLVGESLSIWLLLTQADSLTPETAVAAVNPVSHGDVGPPSPARGAFEDVNNPREVILQSYLPTVTVYASRDTEELVRLKGIYGGLCGLLKPFGEKIHGKVVVRDSSGGSRGWTNFGVRFIDFGKQVEGATWTKAQDLGSSMLQSTDSAGRSQRSEVDTSAIDEVVLSKLEDDAAGNQDSNNKLDRISGATPGYHAHYLRKLLAERPVVPYEPYTHPVACIIAISSQCHGPIETLRDLYRENSLRTPEWAGNEFLRYYVLVHDEDHDDIASSTSLFNQMKRHFGLHCHLLRIRAVECGPDDEDSMELPTCASVTATEEVSGLRRREQNGGVDELQQYLFDTDAAVIRTFVREMVTQSVIPFMEGRVTAWNDQVASKRRGIGGRFMNLSKRFVGFGSGRGSKSSVAGSTSSFVVENGYYEAPSNEAIMHRLADYAFMLRDWKLSNGICEILKADFGDDKAWYHQARVNEMLAFGLLLNASATASSPKFDLVDQALETAIYSHSTRCADPRAALRCLVLAIELASQAGGSGTEEAIKWSDRLLELYVLTPVEQALLSERIAHFYSLRPGSGILGWESRARKAAFWSILTAQVWLSLDQSLHAAPRFDTAKQLYSNSNDASSKPVFASMDTLWTNLHHRLASKTHLPLSEAIAYRGDQSPEQDVEIYDIPKSRENRLSTAHLENVLLLQRLHDPLGQEDDGFV